MLKTFSVATFMPFCFFCRWADIAKVLNGRTENAVKNHWNATLRRRDSEQVPCWPGPTLEPTCQDLLLCSEVASSFGQCTVRIF